MMHTFAAAKDTEERGSWRLEELFVELEKPIYRFLLRMAGDEELARDLTQDTLARGLASQQQLRDARRFKSWLFRIAVNLWKDYCRRPRPNYEPYPESAQASERSPSEALLDRELGEQVWRALTQLPPRQQQVMHLRVVEEMTIGEIASVLDLSTQLVRSNLAAARKNLRCQFKQSGII